jgi:hypothetical protein
MALLISFPWWAWLLLAAPVVLAAAVAVTGEENLPPYSDHPSPYNSGR